MPDKWLMLVISNQFLIDPLMLRMACMPSVVNRGERKKHGLVRNRSYPVPN